MRSSFVFAVLLQFWALAVTAAASEPGSSRLYERWKKADADADGRLSRAESAALRPLQQRFDAIDRDRDGRISLEEIRAWRSSAAARRRSGHSMGIGGFLSRADSDADGALSRAEAQSLPRLAARFAEIDADRDGKLSRPELEAWLAARRAIRSGAR